MSEFQQQLLWAIKDLDEFTTAMLTHRLRLGWMPGSGYYSTLRRMEEKKLLKKKKQGKIVVMSITPEGRKLLKKPSVGKRRKDGLSTIVIFDVPEQKRRARENLRRYLIRHGYTLLQESVLISPTYVTKELKQMLRELGVFSHVTIISGRIDRDF